MQNPGSPTLIYNILRYISDTYDSNQQRYHLCRQLSTNPANNVSSPPWGLMLQLAVKAGPTDIEPHNAQQCMTDLIQLLTATVGLDGLEPSSIYDMLIFSDENIMEFLQRAVTYDALYSQIQIRPKDAARMCSELFDKWIDSSNEKEIRQARDFSQVIWDLSAAQTPFAFHASDLCQRSGLTEDQIVSICDHILAHGASGPNQLLSFPLKPDSIDFGKRPLLRTAHACWLLHDRKVDLFGQFLRSAFSRHTEFRAQV